VGERPNQGFADRLAALVEERRSQIVLGLDPDPSALWPVAVEAGAESGGDATPAAQAAAAVERHCRAAIDAVADQVVAVKPQLACFERLGAPGWQALQNTTRYAQKQGLLVIADGKRGDVPVTARAYAQALLTGIDTPFGRIDGLGADAITANPMLGRDALEPLIEAANQANAGVFVLVRTSNPGAAEIQDEPAEAPLHEKLARLVHELGVGAVTGATRPDLLQKLRDLMPNAIFLLPGVGAQGGSAADLGPAFVNHPAGGLIASSRSIVGAGNAEAARAAAMQLKEAAWNASTVR
jgi:orotidine-5'-phosphate decarboxylase